MSDLAKLYWDSSCFLSVLNAEPGRVDVCKDILKNAELGNIKLYTSLWAVVEVVRPKRPGTRELPAWAEEAIAAIEKDHPQARADLEMLWRRHQSDETLLKLTEDQINKIEGMFFGWKFLELVRIDKGIAQKAVEIQRDYNLKAGDSIHVASAMAVKVAELQRWDRDFNKVKGLVNVTEPTHITPAGPLLEGVTADDNSKDGTKPSSSLAAVAAADPEPSSEPLPPSEPTHESD